MTAYVIVDIDVHDQVGYEEYKKLASAAVELYGRKYIAPCVIKPPSRKWW